MYSDSSGLYSRYSAIELQEFGSRNQKRVRQQHRSSHPSSQRRFGKARNGNTFTSGSERDQYKQRLPSDQKARHSWRYRRFILFLLLLLLLLVCFVLAYVFIGVYTSNLARHATDDVERDFNRLHRRVVAVEQEALSAGIKVYIGLYPPSDTLGTKGSLYLVVDSSVVYYKYTADTWAVVQNATSGTAGPDGQPGGPGPPGANAIVSGLWMSNNTYAVGDIVAYNGSIYYAGGPSFPVTGTVPSNTSSGWSNIYDPALLAAAAMVGPPGDDGADGGIGPRGESIVFQGLWSTGVVYAPGAMVSFQNATYLALVGNVNLQPLVNASSSTWALEVPQSVPQPPGAIGPPGANVTGGVGSPGLPVDISTDPRWNSTSNYTGNSIVIYNGEYYILPPNVSSSVGTVPNATGSPWMLLYPYMQITIKGSPGAKGAKGGVGATGPPGANYQTTWLANVTYSNISMVIYNGIIYASLVSGNVGAIPPSNPAQWRVFLPPAPPIPPGPTGSPGPSLTGNGTWSNTTTYGEGNTVFYNNNYYTSLIDVNLGNAPVLNNGSVSSSWMLMAPANLTIALASPGPIGPPGFGNITGPTGYQGSPGGPGADADYRGYWSSVVGYMFNQVVYYAGSYYRLLTASDTGTLPGSNSAIWRLTMPASVNSTGPVGPPGPPGPYGNATCVGNDQAVEGAANTLTDNGNPTTWTRMCLGSGFGGNSLCNSGGGPFGTFGDPAHGCGTFSVGIFAQFQLLGFSLVAPSYLRITSWGSFVLSSLPLNQTVAVTFGVLDDLGQVYATQTVNAGMVYLNLYWFQLDTVIKATSGRAYSIQFITNYGTNTVHPDVLTKLGVMYVAQLDYV